MNKNIITLSILSIIIISSFGDAGEISLQPSNGKYTPGCTIGVDIVMDPKGAEISATDIVIESSMQLVKFEPTNLFPYFYGPIIEDKTNLIKIIGFTALGKSQRIKEKGIIGKIFFKPKNKSDTDGSIKFYIKNKGDTTDTNLSIGGGVDVLQDTWNGFYTFDGDTCEYLEEDFKDIDQLNADYEKGLKQTLKKVKKDFNKEKRRHMVEKAQKFLKSNKFYIISLLVIVSILIIYFVAIKGKSKQK